MQCPASRSLGANRTARRLVRPLQALGPGRPAGLSINGSCRRLNPKINKTTAYIFNDPLLRTDSVTIVEGVLRKIDLRDRRLVADLGYSTLNVLLCVAAHRVFASYAVSLSWQFDLRPNER
jgi:hypothetical protein